MKKYPFFIPFIVAIIILPCFSCKSTPPPPQQPPQQQESQPVAATPAAPTAPTTATGANQALLNELNTAAARAEQSRTRAGDFEGQSYFPSEWEAAEGQYAQAGQMPKGSDAEVRNAIAAYNAAADSFDSIFTLAVPLYAQAREDEIMAARTSLIERGAKEAFPDFFPPADSTALMALEQYEAGDFSAAKDSSAKALEMYEILTVAWDAWEVKWEIDEREFVFYDPDNYDRAREILSDAMDAYKAENLPSARKNAEESLLRYNLVLSSAWAEYAELRSSLAEGERLAALDMKANVAAREFFAIADTDNKTAQELLEAEEYEEAAKMFTNSEAMFVIASMSVLEKRRIATEALRGAQEKIEESDRVVRQAETIIEGGAQ